MPTRIDFLSSSDSYDRACRFIFGSVYALNYMYNVIELPFIGVEYASVSVFVTHLRMLTVRSSSNNLRNGKTFCSPSLQRVLVWRARFPPNGRRPAVAFAPTMRCRDRQTFNVHNITKRSVVLCPDSIACTFNSVSTTYVNCDHGKPDTLSLSNGGSAYRIFTSFSSTSSGGRV